MKTDGRNLEFASEILCSDKNLVLDAVRLDGRTLEFASEKLKDDKEIVFEAIKQNPDCCKLAS